jgi:hypothetical protein
MYKVLSIVMLALGLGVGAWWGNQQAPTLAAPIAEATSPTPYALRTTLPAVAASIDMSALRTLIREELTAALDAKGGTKPANVPPPPSPETLAKRRDAQADIEGMVAGGVWGNEQRIQFQQRLAVLDPQERDRALQQLFTSLNQGALKLEAGQPPL